METRKRILIVDDEEDICNILSFNLEKQGTTHGKSTLPKRH